MSGFLPAPSMIVVFSFSMRPRFARPSIWSVTFSSLMPRSSEIVWPAVRTAMSSSIALRRSPKPGAFTAATFRPPRSLLTTSVASASPSISSRTWAPRWSARSPPSRATSPATAPRRRRCSPRRSCARARSRSRPALLHDEEILAVDADLGAGPLAEQHAIARLDVERHELSALVASTGTGGDDFALLRLLLGGVGDDDAAFRLLLRFDTADDDAVVQRAKLHVLLLVCAKTRHLTGTSTLRKRVPRALN